MQFERGRGRGRGRGDGDGGLPYRGRGRGMETLRFRPWRLPLRMAGVVEVVVVEAVVVDSHVAVVVK